METDQTQQTDAEDASSDDVELASGAPRESASSFFNRVLRGARDLVGGGDPTPSAGDGEPGDAGRAEQPPERPATPTGETQPQQPAQPETVTVTPEQLARMVQSQKDRELVAERRRDAFERAEAGDVGPIRRLAERGDGWAKAQLAERGETWTLGEIAEAEIKAAAQAAQDPIPHVAALFDQAVLHPLLGALPQTEEQRIVGQGILGTDGRRAATEEAIKVLQREARHEGAAGAVERSLTDAAFVGRLLRSETFRQALIKTPAANKQFRAFFRGDLEEADLNTAAGAGSAGRRENDFMNSWLRDNPAWGDADT